MPKYVYSRKLAEAVRNYLKEEKWDHSFDADTGVFEFGPKVRDKIQDVRCMIGVREKAVVVYGDCPISADSHDPGMMARMAEYICRINCEFENGSFKLDYRNGKIRYESYIDCKNAVPAREALGNSIRCIFELYDKYSAGFVEIIFYNCSAKEACEKTEESCTERLTALEELLSLFDNGNTAEIKTSNLKISGSADRTEPDTGARLSEEPKILKDLFTEKKGDAQ